MGIPYIEVVFSIYLLVLNIQLSSSAKMSNLLFYHYYFFFFFLHIYCNSSQFLKIVTITMLRLLPDLQDTFS